MLFPNWHFITIKFWTNTVRLFFKHAAQFRFRELLGVLLLILYKYRSKYWPSVLQNKNNSFPHVKDFSFDTYRTWHIFLTSEYTFIGESTMYYNLLHSYSKKPWWCPTQSCYQCVSKTLISNKKQKIVLS